MKFVALAYLLALIVMSLITFAFYGWDKRQAQNGGQRTPEAKLHLLAMLGGWPGALVGRQYFRHKTQKTWFTLKTWIIVAIHIGLIVAAAYFYLQS